MTRGAPREVMVVGVHAAGFVAGVWARRGETVALKRSLREATPEGIAPDDEPAKDRWLAGRLRGVRPRGAAVVVVVPRHRIVQHRVRVAGAHALAPAELASAARLQLERRVAVDLGRSSVGVQPEREDECVATLLTGDDAERARAVAGLMRVRAFGVTARALAASGVLADGVLVDATTPQAEAAVLHEGRVVASASLGALDEGEAWSAELRRLWLAARSETRVEHPSRVLVLASEAPGPETLGRFEGALRQEPEVESGEDAELRLLEAVARDRLAGGGSIAIVPFGPPRARVSAGARAALLGTALVSILVGAAVVAAQRDLQRLRTRESLAVERWEERRGEYVRMLRSEARLRHAQLWSEGDPDWLGLVEAITHAVPAGEARVAGLSAQSGVEIVFEPRGRQYAGGAWTRSAPVELTLDVRTRSREAGAALRAAILSEGAFEVETRGADVDDRIELLLRRIERGEP